MVRNIFLCSVKRGSPKSDRILGIVLSKSTWRRFIIDCMGLHGFELCVGMAMAV